MRIRVTALNIAAGMAVLLGFASAQATELTWTATQSLLSGSEANCGVHESIRWNVVLGDDYLTMSSELHTVWKFTKLKFRRDGSGHLIGKNARGTQVDFELDAGTSPRNIRIILSGGICVFLLSAAR